MSLHLKHYLTINCQICGSCRGTFKQKTLLYLKATCIEKMEYVYAKFIL